MRRLMILAGLLSTPARGVETTDHHVAASALCVGQRLHRGGTITHVERDGDQVRLTLDNGRRWTLDADTQVRLHLPF